MAAQEFKASTSVEGRLDLVERVLANRTVQSGSSSTVGILLHGDPGTGKTSFVKFLAHLLGVGLIVIEAPHITEEHIINIPFIVFKDENNGTKHEQGATASGTTIVLADSHLFSEINRATALSDAALLKNIYSSHDQYQQIWEELGGTTTTIPKAISKFRAHTKVILFIDEYFRQPSPRIKNMLRGILNGKLGTHDLPTEAYVMYASNLKDEGVSEMPANNDFEQIEMEAPDKEEWFSWFVNKYKGSDKINMDVVKEFYKLLKQEHLSSHDLEADVRASPRTWEQILLYISASLPAKDEKSAKSLMANISSKFTHYKSGDKHKLTAAVLDVVSKLIKSTSNIEAGTAGNTADEWRNTLEHQLEVKMKLGKLRTYIPIVSGPPGIGKTSQMAKTAHDLNLRYVDIDCSTLDPEMVMGIPVSETDTKSSDKKISVKFSHPQLYQQIMDDIAKADKEYIASLTSDEKKAYVKQKYKYLIFFDELNRTSTKVFNGLRRVLLEKDFGHGLELPEEAIMVAAINPHDLGTQDLSLHVRDVVDVIDSAPSWKATQKYIENTKIDASKVASDTAKNTVTSMLSHLKDTDPKRPADQKHFYLSMGDSPLYLSPREIVSMISNTATNLDLKLERLKPLIETDDKEKLQKAFDTLAKAATSTILGTLTNAMHKQHVEAPEFVHDLTTWLYKNLDIEGIFSKKATTLGLESILEPYFTSPEKDMTKEIELVNYIEGHDTQELKDELAGYLIEKLKADKAHLTDKKHALRSFEKGKVTVDKKELVSNLEHLVRGIVLACKVNKVSAETNDGVKFATRDALKEIIRKLKTEGEEDLTQEALELNGRLLGLFKA